MDLHVRHEMHDAINAYRAALACAVREVRMYAIFVAEKKVVR